MAHPVLQAVRSTRIVCENALPGNLGNMARITPAEHDYIFFSGNRVPQVIHQLQDAAVAEVFVSEIRKLHENYDTTLELEIIIALYRHNILKDISHN